MIKNRGQLAKALSSTREAAIMPMLYPRYTDTYPDSFRSIGRIAPHDVWEKEETRETFEAFMDSNIPPEDYPTQNPMWDSIQRSEWYGAEHYIFLILELEMSYGSEDTRLEFLALNTNHLAIIEGGISQHENDYKDLYLPGERIGYLQFPMSHGHDSWLCLNPSQDSIEEMHNLYSILESL